MINLQKNKTDRGRKVVFDCFRIVHPSDGVPGLLDDGTIGFFLIGHGVIDWGSKNRKYYYACINNQFESLKVVKLESLGIVRSSGNVKRWLKSQAFPLKIHFSIERLVKISWFRLIKKDVNLTIILLLL